MNFYSNVILLHYEIKIFFYYSFPTAVISTVEVIEVSFFFFFESTFQFVLSKHVLKTDHEGHSAG